MLLWNPETGDVLLKPWPEVGGRHDDYCSALACCMEVQKADFEQRKKIILIEAMHLMVRDGIDPQKLHAILLGLDEYRDACASDMPGVDRHD